MSFKHTLIAVVIMVMTMGFLRFIQSAEDIHVNKPFSSFPKQIGNWSGKEDRFDDQIMKKLGVNDYLLCNYRIKEAEIQLYIGFYQSQRKGSIIHSPKNCMPGSGWNILHASYEDLMPPASHERAKVLKMILQKGSEKQMMLYWYQSRGRIVASEYMEKFYLVMDSITRRRTDGAFIRLISPVIGDDELSALSHLKDFANQMLPLAFDYIPS